MNSYHNRHLMIVAMAMIAGMGAGASAMSKTPGASGGLFNTNIVPGAFLQGETVAVEIQPMPLLKASKELAKIFGAPVKVVKTLEPSTLAIYTPATTLDALRSKIAVAYNATWTFRQGIWYLDKSTQQVRSEAAIELEQRRNGIRKMLEKRKKAKEAQKPFTDTEARSLYNQLKDLMKGGFKDDDGSMWRRVEQLENQGPERRFSDHLLSKMTEEMFLAVPEGERRVFALKPTAMQLPLKVDLTAELRRFAEEQNVWSATTAGEPITGGEDMGTYGRLSSNLKSIDQPIDNVLVSVRFNRGNSYTIEYMVADVKGRFAAEGYAGSYDFAEEQLQGPTLETLYGMGEKAKDHEKILSKDGINFRRLLWRADPVTKKPADPEPGFAQRAMKLTERDPLAYSTWEYLKYEAQQLKVSLVGSLPDNTMYLSYGLLNFFRENKGKDFATRFLAMRTVDEGDWMVMAPANPIQERKEYRDRAKMEAQILLSQQKKGKTLDFEAAYALTLPDEESYSPLDELLRRFTTTDEPIYNDRFFLRLYGMIPSSMRPALAAEKGVRLNQLPREVQEKIFKRLYFGDRWSVQYNPQSGEYDEEKSMLFWNGILREPTVSMAGGVPNNTTIKMEIKSEQTLKTAPQQRSYGTDQGQFVTAEELAQRMFYKSRPDLFPWAAENEYYQINPNGLRVYELRTVSFMIDFKNDLQMQGNLTEAEPTALGTFTVDTLPAEFKKKYQESWKQMQEQSKDMRPGMYGPTKSPKKDIPPL